MRPRVGVAIGPTAFHAGFQGDKRLELPLSSFGSSEWGDGLLAAFAELKEVTGIPSAEIAVAVLPPLCKARSLKLPPLSLDQCRRVLTRDAKRYFTGSSPLLVAVRRLRGASSDPNVLAAAIPESVYQALHEAAASVGWAIASVSPAQEAWAMAARSAGSLVVKLETEGHLLDCSRNAWRPVRRLRASEEPSDGAHRVMEAAEAGQVAADFAHGASKLAFVPEADLARERAHATRLTRRLCGVAALLLVLAGGATYLDLRLELASVRARRAERSARVESALRAEERIARLEETVTALASRNNEPAAWGELLTEVAMHLPESAYLTAFGGEADSVALAGVAEDAGSVLETLRRAPSLRGVRLEAPIRQESRPGEAPIERFVVAAKLIQTSTAGAGRGGQP